MLSHLDRILFPDRCEVIEIVPSQRYVYPIFKNGSSSIHRAAKQNGWRVRFNEQLTHINSIDVIVRDPKTRLASGINSYIQIILRDNPTLDPATVEWFALNYLYLNSHYAPQFMWLANLARFVKLDTQLNFLDMKNLTEITNVKRDPGFGSASADLIDKTNSIKQAEMYQRIDNQLFARVNSSITVGQLWQCIKDTDSVAYDYVIGHAEKILKPLNVLS